MIYFDNAATYATDNTDVLKCFFNAQKKYFANSSSSHRLGYLANKAIEIARENVLKTLSLDNSYEVIFNSGATEGINHALKGYALANKTRGNEIIAFKNEHPAVLETLKGLEKNGFKINYINSDANGEIVYEEIKSALNKNTIMVVVMSANNEVGTMNDLHKIRSYLKDYPKCVFFSDVTQSIAKMPTNFQDLDMFAFSAHKFGGLIGSGVLVKKKKIILAKLISGGAQENNMRAGTTPVPLILSTVYALEKTMKNYRQTATRMVILKSWFENQLAMIDEVVINSKNPFPYIINFSLKHKKASVVIQALSNKEIYVSSQSACHAKSNVVSYVLTNMGKSKQMAENSIRVSFSEINTIDEVKVFINELNQILNSIW